MTRYRLTVQKGFHMRKYYIDHLRVFCILLLFPYHTAMIFNAFGEAFYIHGKPVHALTLPLNLIWPWWMSLLFTIAGISAAYSLKKRSMKEFVLERVQKLLIPLLSGIILIIPVQSYIADVFWNQYEGSYFQHYKVFFTRFTDLTGYDGGFTPGHLWFVLFLLASSMVTIPLILIYNHLGKKIDGSKIKLGHIMPLFLVILIMTPILEFTGGKSVGEATACFAIGFFVLAFDEVQDLLERNWLLLAGCFLGILCVHAIFVANGISGIVWDIEFRIVKWFGILAFLGSGKKFFNKTNRLMRYLSEANFPLYYFHQSILVMLGYLVLKRIDSVPLQAAVIIGGTFLLTILCYEICRRFKVACFLFGIKYYKR